MCFSGKVQEDLVHNHCSSDPVMSKSQGETEEVSADEPGACKIAHKVKCIFIFLHI